MLIPKFVGLAGFRTKSLMDADARLISFVLYSVTSEHSRMSYRTGLVRFFGWLRDIRFGADLLEGAGR